MRGVNPGEVWMIDFGMAAKVRPALLLTGEPAADELDLVTVLLHTTSLRSSRWELNIPKPSTAAVTDKKPLCLRGLAAGSLAALETLQERRKQVSQTLLVVRRRVHFSSRR